MVRVILAYHQIAVCVVLSVLIDMMHFSVGRQRFTECFLGSQSMYLHNAAIG